MAKATGKQSGGPGAGRTKGRERAGGGAAEAAQMPSFAGGGGGGGARLTPAQMRAEDRKANAEARAKVKAAREELKQVNKDYEAARRANNQPEITRLGRRSTYLSNLIREGPGRFD